MLKKEYAFYLTDAQRWAIRDVSVSESEVSFTATGLVQAIVWDEYDVRCYTFRKDGEIIRESRSLGSDGWVTDRCDTDGVWHYEVEEN